LCEYLGSFNDFTSFEPTPFISPSLIFFNFFSIANLLILFNSCVVAIPPCVVALVAFVIVVVCDVAIMACDVAVVACVVA
jgi:hypothetical protein